MTALDDILCGCSVLQCGTARCSMLQCVDTLINIKGLLLWPYASDDIWINSITVKLSFIYWSELRAWMEDDPIDWGRCYCCRIKNIKTQLRLLSYVVFYQIFWKLNWCGVNCVSRGLLRLRVCSLTLSSLLLDTHCVVLIIEYWSLNHLHHKGLGRQNKKLEIRCTTEWFKINRDLKQKAPQARLIKQSGRMSYFLTESWWVVCPIDIVCNSLFAHHCSECPFFNEWTMINIWRAYSTFVSPIDRSCALQRVANDKW